MLTSYFLLFHTGLSEFFFRRSKITTKPAEFTTFIESSSQITICRHVPSLVPVMWLFDDKTWTFEHKKEYTKLISWQKHHLSPRNLMSLDVLQRGTRGRMTPIRLDKTTLKKSLDTSRKHYLSPLELTSHGSPSGRTKDKLRRRWLGASMGHNVNVNF